MTIKLLSIPRQRRDCFPYVITAAFGGFVRNRMDLFASDRPGAAVDAFDAAAVGYRGSGHVSPTVRQRLLDFFSQRARRSGSGHCVHLLPDGMTLPGHVPPRADTLDPRDFDAVPYPLIDLWHVALPEGSAAAHLCIRRLVDDRVEISSGAPCILGALDEADDDGVDPAAPHLDAEGRFVPPAMFRGAKITGVREERILLGPIQPDGETRRMVACMAAGGEGRLRRGRATSDLRPHVREGLADRRPGEPRHQLGGGAGSDLMTAIMSFE